MTTQPKEDPQGGSRPYYTAEYKREAVELWRHSGRSAAAVAAQLGITRNLLYQWAEPGGGKKRLSRSGPWKALRPRIADCGKKTPSCGSSGKS